MRRVRTVYCLGGMCGSGKTTLRQQHPDLRHLEVVDIARYYARSPGITAAEALCRMLQRLRQIIEGEIGDVVLEAFFSPLGQARQRAA